MDGDIQADIVLPEGVIRGGGRYRSLMDDAEMVFVPAGVFVMGSEETDIFAREDEKPRRSICMGAFLIDVQPVTNERFRRFIDAGGYEDRRFWSEAGWCWKEEHGIRCPLGFEKEDWDSPDQPASGVSWHEAKAFSVWAGKNLPTEAEWEKAARGTDGRRFPWGEAFPRSGLANFDNRIGRTTAVGSYPEGLSPYGCHDMAGNVNNWCEDWYWVGFSRYCSDHRLLSNPLLDDKLAADLDLSPEEKVDKGGGYGTSVLFWEVLSCAGKVHWKPGARNPWNGFRMVCRLGG
jgi:formylglycine-generating enzyme required for sulfatase activity